MPIRNSHDGFVFSGGSGNVVIDLGVNGNRIDLDADNDTSIRASADDVIDFEAGGTDVMQITSGPLYIAKNVNTETLTGDKTLATTDSSLQFLDPGGSARNVDLPAEAAGLMFIIANRTDSTEDITVREDAGSTTIATIDANEAVLVISDGTNWTAIVGANT